MLFQMRQYRPAVLVLCACFALAAVAQNTQSGPEKEIMSRLRKLRSLSDTDRRVATRKLAMDIRALPAGKSQVGLANALANLSTEGDFGRDTLQAVTDTLAAAVRKTPMPEEKGVPAAPYMELAQLARYEHMKVRLDSPEYGKALARVDEIDNQRRGVDFTLTDLTGKTWTRSDLKGKVVLVNFWATWCPPCRKEMPDLNALYDRFKDQGFVILAISDEKEETVRSFIAQHGYSYPILLDPDRKVNTAYDVEGIPKSFVYDRQGQMVAQSIDMRTRGQFLEMLKKAGLR